MKEMVTRRQCIGPTEVDIHDSAPDSPHVGSRGCKSRFVVKGAFVVRPVRGRDVIHKNGFHADGTITKVLTAGL